MKLHHTRTGIYLGLAAAFAVTLACQIAEPAAPVAGSTYREFPVIRERSGTFSRITRPCQLVIRDRVALSQLALSDIPVDFETEMVLVCGLGPTAGSDLGVRIKRVWQEDSVIRVTERQIHPGADRSGELEIASPWTLVVVPRSDLNVAGYVSRAPDGLIGDPPGPR